MATEEKELYQKRREYVERSFTDTKIPEFYIGGMDKKIPREKFE